MVKRILIACCDEYVREIMVSALENKLPVTEFLFAMVKLIWLKHQLIQKRW